MTQSTYVRNADGRYFRLCRIQPPGAAPELSRFGNSSVFPFPSKSSAVRGSEVERGKPRRRTVPGYHHVSGTVLTAAQPVTRSLNPKGAVRNTQGERARAMPGQQQLIEGRPRRPMFHTGRRLMRQTVPTNSEGPFATLRSDNSARRFGPPASGSARRERRCFGLPLTPESGGPSRHPAALMAPTVNRARRRQELRHAQQDVDRCHPPGRDPGRRGPRQSRRRV
jgi:hypothetical protein